WGRLCLLLSLLLQLPGSQAKCYFQAKAQQGQRWASCSWLWALRCETLTLLMLLCPLRSTQHPIDFPDWCEAHYDSQTCQISVVQKANPSLPCVKGLEHEWGPAGTAEP
ncbi:Prostate-associated microseminoprotein, partial [Tinamus guttatus]